MSTSKLCQTFKDMEQLCSLETIWVFTGYFRDRLPNGSYVEWLESLGAPVRSLYYYVNLRVNHYPINSIDELWVFNLGGDDCTLATYEFNTRTQKLVCTSPFVDDDEWGELTEDEFKARLIEFCNKHHLTPKF